MLSSHNIQIDKSKSAPAQIRGDKLQALNTLLNSSASKTTEYPQMSIAENYPAQAIKNQYTQNTAIKKEAFSTYQESVLGGKQKTLRPAYVGNSTIAEESYYPQQSSLVRQGSDIKPIDLGSLHKHLNIDKPEEMKVVSQNIKFSTSIISSTRKSTNASPINPLQPDEINNLKPSDGKQKPAEFKNDNPYAMYSQITSKNDNPYALYSQITSKNDIKAFHNMKGEGAPTFVANKVVNSLDDSVPAFGKKQNLMTDDLTPTPVKNITENSWDNSIVNKKVNQTRTNLAKVENTAITTHSIVQPWESMIPNTLNTVNHVDYITIGEPALTYVNTIGTNNLESVKNATNPYHLADGDPDDTIDAM
jgi:hypothetical protein